MARFVPSNSSLLLSLMFRQRRTFAEAAAAAGAEASAARAAESVVKASAASLAAPAKPQEIFWMRDPKTGCWMPENRFDDVDPAELRRLLLSLSK